jgi:ribosomal protein L35AE/L33A
MKKISFVLFLAVVLLPFTASTQEKKDIKPTEPSTKLENFLLKKGRLVIKDSYELGMISCIHEAKQMTLDAMVIYEPGQEINRMRGLRIEIEDRGERFAKSNTSFLDLEEIESLSKALSYMSDLSSKWKDQTKAYTEVIFSTKGDFQIGFYQKGSEQGFFSSSGFIGKTTCFLNPSEGLKSIKTIIDLGLTTLQLK